MKFPRIEAIPTGKLQEIDARFYKGVALTADRAIVISGTTEAAHEYACQCFGFDLDASGAEAVILIHPDKFRELLARAGMATPVELL